MRAVAPCPNCAGPRIYTPAKAVKAAGLYGPELLPGLGGFVRDAQFQVVVCGDCGLTRFFADADSTAKLPNAKGWVLLR